MSGAELAELAELPELLSFAAEGGFAFFFLTEAAHRLNL